MKLLKLSFLTIVLLGLLSVNGYGQNTIYIDPTNTGDPEQDGTEAHPYDHWEGLNFQDNTTYLLRRGTVLQEDLITELTNLENTTFGAYGTGDLPRIETKVVRITSCRNLVLQDLDILSDGKHVIEFRHEGKSHDVEINNCKIHSPRTWEVGDYNFGISAGVNGLRIVDSEIYDIYLDGLYFDHANNIVIENSYIHDVNQAYHDNPDGAPGDGIQFNDTDSIFIRNTVIDRTNSGKKFCVIVINPSDDVDVETVVMEDNRFIGPGIHDHGGAGLFFGVPTVTFRRNIVEDAPIGVYSHASDIIINNNQLINNGTGITVASNTADIYNNVFYGNNTAVDSWGNPSDIQNNIVYLTNQSQIGFNCGSCTESNNIQNVSSTSNSSFDAGTIANPQFVDASNHNFRLQSNSPAIDNGVDLGITYDFDKNLIPCNGTPDIGAFEYQGNCSGETNHRPVADAGGNITINEGELATLDGSGSYDPDGDALSYIWEAPSIINLSDPNAEQPSFNAPEVNSDTTINITLEVSDGELTSQPDGVVVTINNVETENTRPVAVTGSDKDVLETTMVQLDGSNSYDPDQDSLRFRWDPPENITLSDPNAERPSFEAPEVESNVRIAIELTVSDGDLVSQPDSVFITIENQSNNTRPVADAGHNDVTYETMNGELDGSGSYDPDGDNISYSWESPNNIILSDPQAAAPYFEAPHVYEDTIVEFILRVSDGDLTSKPDTMLYKIKNQDENSRPVAIAGPDKIVDENTQVYLDGSDSYDPDGDGISYLWESGNFITLSDPNTAEPNFKAPKVNNDTTVLITLKVNDGELTSKPDSIYITINNAKENLRPVAVPGQDKKVKEKEKVNLDGSQSYDPDQDSLEFMWQSPEPVSLSDPYDVKPTFTAPEVNKDTTLVFVLRVSDGNLTSEPDSLFVTVTDIDEENSKPVAEAGEDVVANETERVNLDGSQSYDPDQDSLSFIWDTPEEIILSDSTAMLPYFYVPEVETDTTFIIYLTVTDGNLKSQKDSVKIQVNALVTSINNGAFSEKESFILYPNPTYGELQIRSETTQDLNGLNFRVYSLEGKLLNEKYIGGNVSNGHVINLSVNDLSNGMYILSVQSKGKVLYSKQFIKR